MLQAKQTFARITVAQAFEHYVERLKFHLNFKIFALKIHFISKSFVKYLQKQLAAKRKLSMKCNKSTKQTALYHRKYGSS